MERNLYDFFVEDGYMFYLTALEEMEMLKYIPSVLESKYENLILNW